jgi:splicing factor 1
MYLNDLFLGEMFRAGLGSAENSHSGTGDASREADRKRKKKSRWASSNDGAEGKIFIPGMPTVLPSNLNPDQQEAYLGKYKMSLATHT